MRVSASAVALLLVLVASAPLAQEIGAPEAEPCAGFDWPLTREAAWFSAVDLPEVASGSNLPADRPAARLRLKPSADADLPSKPSRTPKPASFSGFVRLAASPASGQIQVTLSDEGWIDVAEEGGPVVKPGAHSGRKGCPSLRKSVRFPRSAKPLVVMVTNAAADAVRIAVAPVE